jgi:hypothetical protein
MNTSMSQFSKLVTLALGIAGLFMTFAFEWFINTVFDWIEKIDEKTREN